MALYIISFIGYGTTLAFYIAVFPRLARNTPHARRLLAKYEKGEMSPERYAVEDSLEKNNICNTTTVGLLFNVPDQPDSSFTGPQLLWIHRRALPELDFVAAAERRPDGEQLRFGVVWQRSKSDST